MPTGTVGTRVRLFVLVGANALSLVGNAMAAVAIPWFVLETTGSAAKTGIAAFFTTLPLALGAVLGGTVADRIGLRTASIVTDLVSALCIAGIPLLYALDVLEFWHLLALAFATSLFDAPGQAAREGMLPTLAHHAGVTLERATSLWATAEHVGYLVGAPLAGALIAVVGTANVLWLDAASFLACGGLVAAATPRARTVDRVRGRYVAELREGLAFLLHDRVSRTFLGVATIGNMLAAPIALVFLPVYASEVAGGPAALGLLVAAYGVGGLLSAALLAGAGPRLGRRRLYVGGWIVYAGIYLAVAALPPPLVLAAVLVSTGLCALAPIEAVVRQERTPPPLRGRVFATSMAALALAAPPGVFIGGLLVERFGLQSALVTFAAANAGLAAVVSASRTVRRSLASAE